MIPTLIGIVLIQGIALLLVLISGEANRPLVVSAFLGALFPFLFIVAWEIARRIRERKVKAHNALVELELVANKVMATVASNLYQLEMAANIKNVIDEGRVPRFNLRIIPDFPFRVILDFLSTDLVNRTFKLNVDIDVLNSDMNQFQTEYEEVISLVHGRPQKLAQHPEFRSKYDRIFERLLVLQNAKLGMLEFCLEVGAQARVVRNAAEHRFSIAKFLKAPDDEEQGKLVVQEVGKFKDEIRATRELPTLLDKGQAADRGFWIPEDQK
jgi:hypothetical protein